MIWIKIFLGVLAVVLASHLKYKGKTVGNLTPDELMLLLILIIAAFTI